LKNFIIVLLSLLTLRNFYSMWIEKKLLKTAVHNITVMGSYY